MADRSWFLDIVQDCINYEMKLQAVNKQLEQCAALNKQQAARIKELEAGKPHLESVKD